MTKQNVDMLINEAERLLSVRNYKAAHATCIETLKRSPTAHTPYYLLSILTFDHNNFSKALELVDKAIALSNGEIGRYHALKGRIFTTINQRDNAIKSAKEAASCKRNSAQTLDTIGVILSRSGFHSEAIPHYEKATELASKNAAYWYNLGAAQQFVGDMNAAENSYKNTIQLEPEAYKAWSSLTSLKKQSRDKNYLDQLLPLYSKMNDIDGKLNIGHAIAKTYEDLSDIPEQMSWLKKAKEAKYNAQPYDFSNDVSLFNAAKNRLVFVIKNQKKRANLLFS